MAEKDEQQEDEGEKIDWENPYDEYRSSEIDNITFEFQNNGRKFRRLDEKGKPYTQYQFKCIRLDVKTPAEITYITSAKTLIDEIQEIAPLKGKKVNITRSGSGFQTKYKLKVL